MPSGQVKSQKAFQGKRKAFKKGYIISFKTTNEGKLRRFGRVKLESKVIHIPECLCKKSLLEKLSIGLHWIALGEEPEREVPVEKAIPKRVKLDANCREIIEELTSEGASEREVVRKALVLIEERPFCINSN